MRVALLCSGAALGLASFTAALGAPKSYSVDRTYSLMSDLGTNFTVYEHAATGSRTRYVQDSGICETTKGVKQYSGYFDVGTDQNMFFWFFEARKDANMAPVALWLNGGPGCSSMLGLFQENGPCTFNKAPGAEPVLNPNSWNNVANMLYVDQPIGSGFSYGTSDTDSTVKAAPKVWALMQSFYSKFPDYKGREFGLFTESYGGHYGPEFIDHFQSQNDAIDKGTVKGEKIKIVALGIGNGWIDPVVQYKDYVEYAVNNTYNKIIDQGKFDELMQAYEKDCKPAMAKCTGLEGQNDACVAAETACYNAVEAPIEAAKTFNVYDVRAQDDKFPPETYQEYIKKPEIMKAIGAKSEYKECPQAPYDKFTSTGDGQRSFLNKLQDITKKDVQVLIWAGDADFICNYIGNYNAAKKIGGEEFEKAEMKDFNLNGKKMGEYKNVKNLSWLRVHEAGHEVPAYQPEVALEAFKQTMARKVKGNGNRLDRETHTVSRLHLMAQDKSTTYYNSLDNQINYLSREIVHTIRHKVNMPRLEATDEGPGFEIEVHHRQTSHNPDVAHLKWDVDVLHKKMPAYRMQHAVIEYEDYGRFLPAIGLVVKRNGKWRHVFSTLKTLEAVSI
ncbi:serine carboxypeptidase [Colletotrichum orchidophilum]|uniref:Carboxypeptidase n=1 Tax=Colletotrichum orchidophilum TaxID=1209926 RepID=A0A1G4BL04_9PEZI|nr:serine carboxypeptidase [Colletotrichum orchidophilum]OHF02094.1 serine carboxypeptidase [Colletotrichum orchidophilum]